MALLLVNYEYPPIGGGAANATHFIARAMRKLGQEVVVITAGMKKDRGYRVEEDVHVYRIPALRGRVDQASMLEMFSFVCSGIMGVASKVRKHGVDKAIVFFTIPCGPIGLRLKALGVPYVISLRGGDVPGLVPEIVKTHRWLAPLRRRCLREAKAVVANAEGLADLSRQTDPYEVGVIPNGVDADFFCPSGAKSVAKSGAVRLLFVGRFQEQKNLGALLRAMARLRDEGRNCWLEIVGAGPLGESLKKMAQDLELGERLHWHGWKTREALLKLYQSVDMLCSPALYEGMPNVLLEALACGCPVVASDIPGNREVVVHESTGLLYPLQDEEALTSSLRRLIEDDGLRTRCGRGAVEHVKANFSWTKTARKYLDLF